MKLISVSGRQLRKVRSESSLLVLLTSLWMSCPNRTVDSHRISWIAGGGARAEKEGGGARALRPNLSTLQGYLAHQKLPPTLGPP